MRHECTIDGTFFPDPGSVGNPWDEFISKMLTVMRGGVISKPPTGLPLSVAFNVVSPDLETGPSGAWLGTNVISIVAAGGTPPYTYTWSRSSGTTVNMAYGVNSPTMQFSSTGVGVTRTSSFQGFVTDANTTIQAPAQLCIQQDHSA